MDKVDIKKLVGLSSFIEEVEKDSIGYKNANSMIKPDNLILNLDRGEGRTETTTYLTDMFYENNVLDFNSSLYDYYEMDFSGDPDNMNDYFKDYDIVLPTYSNYYKLVIAVHIDKIAEHIMEKSFIDDFIKNAKRICKNSFVIFYISSNPTSNEEKLVSRIIKECGNVKRINNKGYSKEDLLNILTKKIYDYGINIKDFERTNEVFFEVIKEKNVSSIKELDSIFYTVIKCCSYKDKILNYENLLSAFNLRKEEKEHAKR